MLRRIKEKFWNMKFRRKLLFSHTMVCVIPIVILGFFCYQQVLHLMMEREKESLSQSMKQAEQTVDAELESYGNIVTYLSMHSQIQDYLKKDYQNTSKDYYVQHEFYMNLLAPTMLNLGIQHDGLDNISIYTENPMSYRSEVIMSLQDVKEEEWAKEAPLSKSKREFKGHDVYMYIVIFAMLFSGGMIPIYLTIKSYGLLNSIWALILPGAVPVFNVILLMNFFKGVPKSLEEAAAIDGASKLTILLKIYLPISMPALATIILFCIVNHWNDFFSGLVYMNKTSMYPLQTYIQQLSVDMSQITDPEQLKRFAQVSNKTLDAAKIVVSTIPLLIIYPFLQKYFVSGIVIGAVKE